jgi:geranylgeranyl reductase family protein
MERFDALVVGAGPAGSTAAYRLSREGASVLLVDRARFPRDKPCGGGLTMRAVRQLPFAVEPVVEDRATRFTFGLDFRHRFERTSKDPLVLLTQRRRLDHFLVERAVEAGADFRDGVRIEVGPGGREARIGTAKIDATVLVCADGANGQTARATGIQDDRDYGVALEANVPHTKVDHDRFRGRLILELGVLPGGYGWVFPKGDHVNVGVGGWETEGPRLRRHLGRLCDVHGIAADDLESVRGYRLPCRAHDSSLARGRGLIVGDAAGLIDPLSGDGMYEAFVSGAFAAEAIERVLAGEEPTLDGYGTRLTRHLAVHLWASWTLKAALDRFPRTAFVLATGPLVWPAIESVVAGELPDLGAARGLVRAPLKAIGLLGRAAGDPGAGFRPPAVQER